MKKALSLLLLTAVVVASVFSLCSCSTGERIDKLAARYCEKIGPSITEYFSDLSEKACGVRPERVTSTMTCVSLDYLKKTTDSFETILENKQPVFVVNLVMPGSATDDNIELILKEAIARNIDVNLCFNNDDSRVFCIRDGSVTVDLKLGQDGGAMHEEIEYVFSE